MITYLIIPVAFLLISLLSVTLRRLKKIDLRGKHVVVSGGSKGIGKELASQCYQRGAKVTILARDEKVLQEATEYIVQNDPSRRGEIHYFSIDVSKDYETVLETFKLAEEKLGPIDGLFNVVGKAVCSRFLETPLEEFDNMMAVNYFSAINCTRAATTLMVKRNSGFIELTSSLAGVFGVYGLAAYSASKFALVGLAEAIAMEVSRNETRRKLSNFLSVCSA